MSYNGFPCGNRLSIEDHDFYELKNKAAEFYQRHRVPQEIERALNDLFFRQPEDIYGYLANYFTKLSAPPRISKLKGKEVYDARGQLSIQAEVFCIIRNEEKLFSSAVISSHCGLPKETSPDLDAKSKERSDHVTTALQWINEPLSEMLKGLDPCDQAGVDHVLSDFFMARYLEKKDTQNREKENLSPSKAQVEPPTPPPAQTKERKSGDKGKKGNSAERLVPPRELPEPVLPGSWAIGSVSLAVAKTGAQIQGIPLYKYIAALKNQEAQMEFHVPVFLVTLLSCGKTSPGKLNLLEEVILIPTAGQRVKQADSWPIGVVLKVFSNMPGDEIITMALELQNEMMRIMNTSSKAGAVQAALSDTGAPAVGCERPEQPLDLIAEACGDLGLALGTEIHLAVNCAAHELMDYSKGKYEVATGSLKSPDELVDMYQALVSKYPAVVALIDPLRKEDVDQWEKLSSAIGSSCLLLSDVASKPIQALPLPGVRGHVLRQTNETTISDLIRITSDYQGAVIMGTTCREPCSDGSLSDVEQNQWMYRGENGIENLVSVWAVGLGMGYVKLGGLSGGERLTNYNRLISIEEELAQQGILVSKEKRLPLLFGEKPEEQQTAP